MIWQFFIGTGRTLMKLLQNLVIVLQCSLLILPNILTQPKLVLKCLLGIILYSFLVVADAWGLILHPTLLLLKDFEAPLYFFLQVLGISPPSSYLAKQVRISADSAQKLNMRFWFRLLRSTVVQSLGFLFLCLLLNNQIYLNDELSLYENWKLVLVIVVSVSIWIPAGQLKRRAQEQL